MIKLVTANIYHYIFIAYLGDPRFGFLLKITLLLDPLEDRKVAMLVTERRASCWGWGRVLGSIF